MTNIIRAVYPFAGWDFTVARDSRWNDKLPQLVDPDGTPFDLTGITVQLFVRVRYGTTGAPIDFLTSVGSAGIVIDDAANGLISTDRSQALVEVYPIGDWVWYMRVTSGASFLEIARGKFSVYDGSDQTV